MAVFGDEASVEVVKGTCKGRALVQEGRCLRRKRKRHPSSLSEHTRREGRVRLQGGGGCLEAGKDVLTRRVVCSHFDCGLLASGAVRNQGRRLKPPSPWHFVMAAPTN